MKRLFTIASLLCALDISAQTNSVGINTTAPDATLDVAGTPDDPVRADGVIVPRLTLAQLNAKTGYGTAQTGALVYITAAASGTVAATAGIGAPGYYYFDGSRWFGMQSQSGTVVFTASLGSGNGLNVNPVAGGGFNTVPLPNVTKNIGGGTWDPNNYIYTVPVSGTYLIKSSVRLTDNSASRNIFQAVGIENADIAEGIWGTSNPSPNSGGRWTMLYNRVAYFNKGDQLRLYIYSEGMVANLSDATLNIVNISAN